MAKSILLFNGIYYSFTAVSRAFAWAKQTGGSLEAIFLRSENEEAEGYGFPSDLDAAEDLNSNQDAENEDDRIIHHHMEMLERNAAEEKIDLKTLLLVDPTIPELHAKCSGAEKVFIPRKFEIKGTLSVDIDIDDLTKHLPSSFEIIDEA